MKRRRSNLSSGRELAVEHPVFMLGPPAGDPSAVWDRKHHIHVADIGHVEEIDRSPVKKENSRTRRK